jgi:hypothetical protein
MKISALLTSMLVRFASPKKDSDAPPPDPSVGRAQERLAALAERQQDFTEKEITPKLLAQLQQNTDISKQVADANLKQMDFQSGLAKKYDERYWGTQVPLEDQLIAKAKGFNEASERERMAGEAGADVEQAAGIGNANLQRGLRLRGINLGSGAAIGAMAESNHGAILAKAGAMNKTREIARQMGWTRLGEAAALGRGLPGFGATSAGLAINAGNGGLGAAGQGLNGVATAGSTANANTNTQGNLWGSSGNMGVGVTQSNNSYASAANVAATNSGSEMMGTAIGAIATMF